MHPQTVRTRISTDPELRALYTRDRRLKDTALAVINPITKLDLEKYRAALKVYGVSDNHLEKLKALDGLADDNPQLLAISFRVSHQSYVGQLHNLDEVADDIKARLRGSEMEDGTYKPLDNADYAALATVYTQCVKERGRGFRIMMDGVMASMKMEMAMKGNEPHESKASPGWGPMKKVRAPTDSEDAAV